MLLVFGRGSSLGEQINVHVMVTCLVCCEWPGDISSQCLLNSRSCCLPQHLRSGLTPAFIMAECEYVRSISRRSPVPHESAAVAEATTRKRKFRRPWFKSASSNAMPVPRKAQLGSWTTAWSASVGVGRLLRQEFHLIALDIKPLVNVAEVLVGCLEALIKKVANTAKAFSVFSHKLSFLRLAETACLARPGSRRE